MNIDELKQVVTKIQLGDNRQVDLLVLREWEDNIGHLPFKDAIAAVRMHRQEATEYLQAAHVIRNAARLRSQRALASAPTECDKHAGYPVPCASCARDVEWEAADV